MDDPTLAASPIICMGVLLIYGLLHISFTLPHAIVSVFVKIWVVLSHPRMIWKEWKLFLVEIMELHGLLLSQLQRSAPCKLLSILQPVSIIGWTVSWFCYKIVTKIKLEEQSKTTLMRHFVHYLVSWIPRIPPGFNSEIKVAEGKPGGSHWNHRICITTASREKRSHQVTYETPSLCHG
jgi:hypothetical protein